MIEGLVALCLSTLSSYLIPGMEFSFTGQKEGVAMRCLIDDSVAPEFYCLPTPFSKEQRHLAQRYGSAGAAKIYRGE